MYMYVCMHQHVQYHLVTSFDRRESGVFERRQRLQDLVGLDVTEAGRGHAPQRLAATFLRVNHLYRTVTIPLLYYY